MEQERIDEIKRVARELHHGWSWTTLSGFNKEESKLLEKYRKAYAKQEKELKRTIPFITSASGMANLKLALKEHAEKYGTED